MHRITFALVATLVFALATATDAAKKKIVVIGGKDSHGASAHNWGEGTDLLVKALNEESGLDVEGVVRRLAGRLRGQHVRRAAAIAIDETAAAGIICLPPNSPPCNIICPNP